MPMFDDDAPTKKTTEFPRNLDAMSVDEIADYIGALKAEIIRAEANSQQKQASKSIADSVFKL